MHMAAGLGRVKKCICEADRFRRRRDISQVDVKVSPSHEHPHHFVILWHKVRNLRDELLILDASPVDCKLH